MSTLSAQKKRLFEQGEKADYSMPKVQLMRNEDPLQKARSAYKEALARRIKAESLAKAINNAAPTKIEHSEPFLPMREQSPAETETRLVKEEHPSFTNTPSLQTKSHCLTQSHSIPVPLPHQFLQAKQKQDPQGRTPQTPENDGKTQSLVKTVYNQVSSETRRSTRLQSKSVPYTAESKKSQKNQTEASPNERNSNISNFSSISKARGPHSLFSLSEDLIIIWAFNGNHTNPAETFIKLTDSKRTPRQVITRFQRIKKHAEAIAEQYLDEYRLILEALPHLRLLVRTHEKKGRLPFEEKPYEGDRVVDLVGCMERSQSLERWVSHVQKLTLKIASAQETQRNKESYEVEGHTTETAKPARVTEGTPPPSKRRNLRRGKSESDQPRIAEGKIVDSLIQKESKRENIQAVIVNPKIEAGWRQTELPKKSSATTNTTKSTQETNTIPYAIAQALEVILAKRTYELKSEIVQSNLVLKHSISEVIQNSVSEAVQKTISDTMLPGLEKKLAEQRNDFKKTFANFTKQFSVKLKKEKKSGG